MYSIYAGDECIYSDRYSLESNIITDATLTLEDNSSGSLEIVLPNSNSGYSSIIRMKTLVTVKRDGVDIWQGRVLSETSDFYNNRTLHCEGALGFLNDSVQTKQTYTNTAVADILTALLSTHNSQVNEAKKIKMGECEIDYSISLETDFAPTMDYISDIIDSVGGHITIRYEDGERYLDYYEDYPNVSEQSIDFGKNLLDFTTSFDLSDLVTVLIPLGASNDSDGNRVTVASVNGGSIYVESTDAIESYGRIIKTANWDNITDPTELLTTAKQYLSEGQFDAISLEVSAIDLSLMTKKTTSIQNELVYSGVSGGCIVIYNPSSSTNLAQPGDEVVINWSVPGGIPSEYGSSAGYFINEVINNQSSPYDYFITHDSGESGTYGITVKENTNILQIIRGCAYLSDNFDIYVKKTVRTGVKPINILDYVHVISKPHGLDSYFPVTKLEIPLLNPENAKFTLNQTVSVTLTDAYNGTAKTADTAATTVINANKRVSEVRRVSANHFTVTVCNANGTDPVTNTFNIETDTSGNTVFHNTTNNTYITFKGW